jgi:hypothetical protein
MNEKPAAYRVVKRRKWGIIPLYVIQEWKSGDWYADLKLKAKKVQYYTPGGVDVVIEHVCRYYLTLFGAKRAVQRLKGEKKRSVDVVIWYSNDNS